MDDERDWPIAEPDAMSIRQNYQRPLDALADGDVAALVLRQFVDPAICSQLIQRCVDRNLLYDPEQPDSAELDEQSIPEGYYREGTRDNARQAWDDKSPQEFKRRIDIGSSLGYRGSDQPGFFEHASATNKLFEELFSGMPDLVAECYGALQELSIDKRVETAREKDGRLYGPAIIRAHYGGYAYKPHFDSVRNREKRTDYSIYNFECQFAGVLVLQNSEFKGHTAQSRIHRCFWEPEVAPYLQADNFPEYARLNKIPSREVILDPGDLYFFNTGCIHEVPAASGKDARIVLAMFIGYSPDNDLIHVWS